MTRCPQQQNCRGITRQGRRCRRRTRATLGYCYIHTTQEVKKVAVEVVETKEENKAEEGKGDVDVCDVDVCDVDVCDVDVCDVDVGDVDVGDVYKEEEGNTEEEVEADDVDKEEEGNTEEEVEADDVNNEEEGNTEEEESNAEEGNVKNVDVGVVAVTKDKKGDVVVNLAAAEDAYADDIYRNLRHIEATQTRPSPPYLAQQPEINEKMRSILIDWLTEVHLKFKLRHETIFLTVNLIDRFLERQKVARNKLQLVGIGCLMLAAKYEEIYPPEVRDYVYICDNAYTRNQILQMEALLLNRLDFRLSVCTPHTFLRRFVTTAARKGDDGNDDSEILYNMTAYIIELSFLDTKMIEHLPSFVTAAALSVALTILCRPETWQSTLAKCRYTERCLTTVRNRLIEIVQSADKLTLKATIKKYTLRKFDAVSAIATKFFDDRCWSLSTSTK